MREPKWFGNELRKKKSNTHPSKNDRSKKTYFQFSLKCVCVASFTSVCDQTSYVLRSMIVFATLTPNRLHAVESKLTHTHTQTDNENKKKKHKKNCSTK